MVQDVLDIIQQEHALHLTVSRRETFRQRVNANLCDQREEHAAELPAQQSLQVPTSAVGSRMALHPARHTRTPPGQELPVRKWSVPRHAEDPSAAGNQLQTTCSTIHRTYSLSINVSYNAVYNHHQLLLPADNHYLL